MSDARQAKDELGGCSTVRVPVGSPTGLSAVLGLLQMMWLGEAQVSQFLQVALEACSKGVASCHSVPAHVPGALLTHLLKAASSGALVHTA